MILVQSVYKPEKFYCSLEICIISIMRRYKASCMSHFSFILQFLQTDRLLSHAEVTIGA